MNVRTARVNCMIPSVIKKSTEAFLYIKDAQWIFDFCKNSIMKFLDNGKGLQRMLLDHRSKMLIQVGLAGDCAF